MKASNTKTPGSIGPFTLAELAEHEAKRDVRPTAPWGEAHLREADARGHELAAVATRNSVRLSVGWPVNAETTWRAWLRDVAGFDAARIDREVALVRALAEATPEVRAMIQQAHADHARVVRALADGRLVRETSYGVRGANGSRKARAALTAASRAVGFRKWTRAEAHQIARQCGGTVLRIARSRMAP